MRNDAKTPKIFPDFGKVQMEAVQMEMRKSKWTKNETKRAAWFEKKFSNDERSNSCPFISPHPVGFAYKPEKRRNVILLNRRQNWRPVLRSLYTQR